MVQTATVATEGTCASWYSTFEIPSFNPKTPEAKYTVYMFGPTRTGVCTCKAFRFSGPKRTCKHVDYINDHACLWSNDWRPEGFALYNPTFRMYPVADTIALPSSASYIQELKMCPSCHGEVLTVF